MHEFGYRGGRLFCEGVLVESLARRYGTPLFVYSQATLTGHVQRLHAALASLDHLICFAIKANSNVAVLKTMVRQGCGFDVVSAGELRRALAAGADPERCVFAGVGKTEEEIAFALKAGIYCLNAESEPEIERISRVARRVKRVAPIALRVNPNIDAGTHAKITTGTYENKFGIAFEQIERVYAWAARLRNIAVTGLQMHIGSQLTEVRPFAEAVRKIVPLAERLIRRYEIKFVSIGGGLGIVYQPALASGEARWWEAPAARNVLTPDSYAEAVVPLLKPLGLRVLIEPGRFVSGNAGILVTRVEYVKSTAHKSFVIVDAAMNDLIRPAFYDSYHEIVPLRRPRGTGGKTVKVDVVGPICESGDYFAKGRELAPLREGDYIGLMSAGAYGSVMGSNYNSRPLPAEAMVSGRQAALVRERQPVEDIWRLERLPSWLKQAS